jgi:galactonate dehydratase
MKITQLELIHVRPRWMFLRVHTDEGLIGYGEPIVEGKARTVESAIRELESYLIGEDPLKIEHHWQAMYRGAFYRGGPVLVSAISGIEQALWDIKGKYYGMPVYEMLGGACRHKIRMYAHCHGDTTEESVGAALQRKQQGFTAIKIGLDAPVQIVDNMASFHSRCGR